MHASSPQRKLAPQAGQAVIGCLCGFHLALGKMLLIALGVISSLCSTAHAQLHGSRLVVTATVLKHASLKVLAQPTSVVITAADIARGYVDVPIAAQVSIQSNSQEGYMLMFASEGEFLHQTVVRGLGNDIQLSAGGGGVVRKAVGRGMAQATLDLGFRFLLSGSARQGIYAWPIRLSVAAV